jgi:hypothetical protein
MIRIALLGSVGLLVIVAAAAAGPGQPSWTGVPVAMVDGANDGTITSDGRYHAGGDVLALRIRNTPCEVDFLVELAALPDTSVNVFLDADDNEQTGCQDFLGAEYLLRLVQVPGVIAPEVQFLDWRTCSAGTTGDLSVGATYASGRNRIELSIPVAALQSLAPGTQGFNVFASTGLIGDAASDFLLPPVRYDAKPQFSDSCANRPETPGRGGSIHLGGFALPPPLPAP